MSSITEYPGQQNAEEIYDGYFTPLNAADKEITDIKTELYPQQQEVLKIISFLLTNYQNPSKIRNLLFGNNILNYLGNKGVFPKKLTRVLVKPEVLGRAHEILSDANWSQNNASAAVKAYQIADTEYQQGKLGQYYAKRFSGFYHMPRGVDIFHTIMVEETPTNASLFQLVWRLTSIAHEIGHFLDGQRLAKQKANQQLNEHQLVRISEYNQQYLSIKMYKEIINIIKSLPPTNDLQNLKTELEENMAAMTQRLSQVNKKFTVSRENSNDQPARPSFIDRLKN